MNTDHLRFLLDLAEDILGTIQGCKSCNGCSELAASYFESVTHMEDLEKMEDNISCLKNQSEG